MPATPLAYDVNELHELLPFGRNKVRRLAKEIGRRYGRSYLVSAAALDAWLNGDKVSDTPPSAASTEQPAISP